MGAEERARKTIDDLLAAAGWAVQDHKLFEPNAARGIALREVPLQSGRCDYLLLVDRAALGIIEAKREGTLLSGVADQSAFYGGNLPPFLQAKADMRFLYESTGAETFFRDMRDPEPRSRQVFAFHARNTGRVGAATGNLACPVASVAADSS